MNGRRSIHWGCPFSMAMVVFVAVGCSSRDDGPTITVEKAETDFSNCLVIVLDAARAGSFSYAGAERPTTPFVDSLTKAGLYFESAYSQATSTSPSAWSYLTGRYPYWPESGSAFVARDEDYLLAEAFQGTGFRTGGFSENPYIRERYGFEQGFDRFEYIPYFHTDPKSYQYADTFEARPSGRVVEEAAGWLRSVGDEPWFCYVHLLRPHTPYVAPEPFAGRFLESEGAVGLVELRDREAGIMDRFFGGTAPTHEEVLFLRNLYAGNLAYGDSLVEKLHDVLKELGTLDDTLIVVMSDHGEAFMEHGRLLHSSSPYHELVHVPLMFRAPESASFVRGKVSGPVQLVDLFPTLGEMFGLGVPDDLDGRSLLGAMRGAALEAGRYVFAENSDTRSLSVQRGDVRLVAWLNEMREGFARRELYDLNTDPGESADLYGETDESAELSAVAEAYFRSRTTGEALSFSDLSEEEREELRALGYTQ